MKPKQGVWSEATKRYVYVRFMYGDSIASINKPNGIKWTVHDVEEILREATKTLDTKWVRLP